MVTGPTHPPGGYDSDLERERNIDYSSKTYAQSTRDPTLIKPHQSVAEGGMAKKRGVVSRSVTATPRVVTQDKAPKVTVSTYSSS